MSATDALGDTMSKNAEPAPLVGIFCPQCGYDLRGIQSPRCPECGLELDRAKLAALRLPWALRGRSGRAGRIVAYLRTAWLLIRRPRVVAEVVAGPVDADAAREFARVTMAIALLGPAVMAVFVYAMARTGMRGGPWYELTSGIVFRIDGISRASPQFPPHTIRAWTGWLLDVGMIPAAWIGWWLFLRAAVGWLRWWFALPAQADSSDAGERASRAAAVGNYAAAPFVLTPFSVFALASLAVLANVEWDAVGGGVALRMIRTAWWAAAIALPATQLLAMVIVPLRMLRRATQCGAGRVIVAAIALPLGWALLAALLAVGVPAAYTMVAFIIVSLIG